MASYFQGCPPGTEAADLSPPNCGSKLGFEKGVEAAAVSPPMDPYRHSTAQGGHHVTRSASDVRFVILTSSGGVPGH